MDIHISPKTAPHLSPPRHRAANDAITHALQAMRDMFDMDVAFVSEFVGDRRVFRYVSSGALQAPIGAGDVVLLDDGYCQKIVDGRLPQLIPDTSLIPAALIIPATQEMPIGSHIGIPIYLSNGKLYGTFCCFSFNTKPHLEARDLQIVSAFASIVSRQIEAEVGDHGEPFET